MVPDNFNWKTYSKQHGITEKRFYYILSFIRKYDKFKKDYEECYSSFRITSFDILPKRRYVDSYIEVNAIRATYIKSRIDLIERTARAADYKLAPLILKYLTTDCSIKDIVKGPEVNGDKEYFEKCWRYYICLLDAELKREKHNL